MTRKYTPLETSETIQLKSKWLNHMQSDFGKRNVILKLKKEFVKGIIQGECGINVKYASYRHNV